MGLATPVKGSLTDPQGVIRITVIENQCMAQPSLRCSSVEYSRCELTPRPTVGDTLQHSALNWMSTSNPCPQCSGIYAKGTDWKSREDGWIQRNSLLQVQQKRCQYECTDMCQHSHDPQTFKVDKNPAHRREMDKTYCVSSYPVPSSLSGSQNNHPALSPRTAKR